MKKTLIILAVLIVIAISAIGYYMYSKPLSRAEDLEVFARISSTELFDEFTEAEAEATARYAGRVLLVHGIVQEVLLNLDSGKAIILGSDDLLFGVKCQLNADAATEQLPAPGDSATIKGFCAGINSDVELNRCVLEK